MTCDVRFGSTSPVFLGLPENGPHHRQPTVSATWRSFGVLQLTITDAESQLATEGSAAPSDRVVPRRQPTCMILRERPATVVPSRDRYRSARKKRRRCDRVVLAQRPLHRAPHRVHPPCATMVRAARPTNNPRAVETPPPIRSGNLFPSLMDWLALSSALGRHDEILGWFDERVTAGDLPLPHEPTAKSRSGVGWRSSSARATR